MKTKNKKVAVIFAALCSVAFSCYFYEVVRPQRPNDLLLENAEALAAGEVTKNTGPAKILDCPGLGTGDWKACMCVNTNPCTETSCK